MVTIPIDISVLVQYEHLHTILYRLGTVNSKSFVGKDFLRLKWKYELTVHFKYEMIGKW